MEILVPLDFELVCKGAHIPKIKEIFTEKKQQGLAMGFASFVIADAKEVGPTAAFALEMPFEEDAIIMESKAFLFENMNMIHDRIMIVRNSFSGRRRT